MKTKSLMRKLGYVVVVGISIGVLFFMIACTWIGYEVKDKCQEAEREYKGDCVESLTQLLQDEKHNFRTRNEAIWALGQLGDNRALPTLQSFYTGVIPEREPLDDMISQYELKKAITLANGGKNITAWIWRNRLFVE